MFRISFFVDDKNLGEAFKRLAGIARNIEHQYVVNLEPKPNGKVHTSSADSQEAFLNEMRKRKLTSVNASEARDIVTSLGFSPSSYSYMLQGLIKSGVLKKTGTPQKHRYQFKGEK
jgi:hypothetical protein